MAGARARGIALVFAVVLTVTMAGCAGVDAEAETSSASPSRTPSAATTATPPSTPTPTPTATPSTDPADPATWVISFDAIGPLVSGAPLADVPGELAAFRQLRAPDTQCSAYVYVLTDGFNASVRAERGDPSRAAESTVFWKGAAAPTAADVERSPRTASGIGIGSSLDQLKAAYPELRVTQESGVPTYGITDGSRWILFRDLYAGGTVTAVQVGTNTMIANEVC